MALDSCGITGIDHTLVGVRDLEAARAAWARLGFTVTPRGRHIGWGTGNYCVMLEEGYVELLGIVDPGQFSNNLDKLLEKREGLLGLAFATPDANACRDALEAAGLKPDGPKQLKRDLELPTGTVTPEFRLVFLPPEFDAGGQRLRHPSSDAGADPPAGLAGARQRRAAPALRDRGVRRSGRARRSATCRSSAPTGSR